MTVSPITPDLPTKKQPKQRAARRRDEKRLELDGRTVTVPPNTDTMVSWGCDDGVSGVSVTYHNHVGEPHSGHEVITASIDGFGTLDEKVAELARLIAANVDDHMWLDVELTVRRHVDGVEVYQK